MDILKYKPIYSGGNYLRYVVKRSYVNTSNSNSSFFNQEDELYDVSDEWLEYLGVYPFDVVHGFLIVDVVSTQKKKQKKQKIDPQNESNIFYVGFWLASNMSNEYPIKRKDGEVNKKFTNNIIDYGLTVMHVNELDTEDVKSSLFLPMSEIPPILTLNYLKSDRFGLEGDDFNRGISIVSLATSGYLDEPFNRLPIATKEFYENFFKWDVFDPFDPVSYEIKKVIFDPIALKYGDCKRRVKGASTSTIARLTWEYLFNRVVQHMINSLSEGVLWKELKLAEEDCKMLELSYEHSSFVVNLLSQLISPILYEYPRTSKIKYHTPECLYHQLVMIDLHLKKNGIGPVPGMLKGLNDQGVTEDGIKYDYTSSLDVLTRLYETSLSTLVKLNKDHPDSKKDKMRKRSTTYIDLESLRSDEDDAFLDVPLPGEELTKQGYVKGFVVDSEDEEDEEGDDDEGSYEDEDSYEDSTCGESGSDEESGSEEEEEDLKDKRDKKKRRLVMDEEEEDKDSKQVKTEDLSPLNTFFEDPNAILSNSDIFEGLVNAEIFKDEPVILGN